MAKKGYGSIFKLGSTTIGELIAVSRSGVSATMIDTSNMGNADSFRTFIKGLRDPGAIQLTVQYEPAAADTAGHNALMTSFETDDIPVAMTLQFGTVAVLTFNGLVSEVGQEVPLDDKLTCSFTVKISGKPTLTDVS